MREKRWRRVSVGGVPAKVGHGEHGEGAQETASWGVVVGVGIEGYKRGSRADFTGGDGHRAIPAPTLPAGRQAAGSHVFSPLFRSGGDKKRQGLSTNM